MFYSRPFMSQWNLLSYPKNQYIFSSKQRSENDIFKPENDQISIENVKKQQQQHQQELHLHASQILMDGLRSKEVLSEGKKSFGMADFYELTKFKLSLMNTLVALPTYIFVSGSVSAGVLIPLAVATQLMAMSSQTINQIIEQEHDAKMIRTQRRPLPSGLISSRWAWALAGSSFLCSNAIFLTCFPLSTALIANSILLSYIAIYTPMKRVTNFNTAVGAVVGALTPYIGYTAAGGSFTDLYPLYYLAYMTFWQFQHFYGISWIYKNDYLRAGYKMCHERNEAMFYMASSFALNIAANIALFSTSPVYPILPWVYSGIMGAAYAKYFIWPAYTFYSDPTIQEAKKLKRASYLHLLTFFSLIIFDMCLRIYENKCKKLKEQLDSKAEEEKVTTMKPDSFIGWTHSYILSASAALQSASQKLDATQQQNQQQQQQQQLQQSANKGSIISPTLAPNANKKELNK